MLRILLIDDNPTDRLLTIRELDREFAPVQVTQAIDAASFEQALLLPSLDLAITDYQLHWSDGITVVRTIKARRPTLPVIMFTNTATQENAVEAMKAGLDDYVIKSARHFVRLTTAVRTVLDRVATQRRVVQLEDQLQRLLNQLNVGVFRATPEGRILESNQAFRQVLNLDPSSDWAAIDLRQWWGEAVAAEPQEIQLPGHGDAPPRWVRLTQFLNTTAANPVVEGLVEDITDRKQAEQALRLLNESLEAQVQARTAELAEVNAQLEAFASSVSHDLRAPLRAIGAFAQILQSESASQLDQQGQSYLQRIINSAQQMQALIADLLDYSRLSRANLRLEVVDLNAAVAAAIAELQPDIQSQQAELAVARGLPRVVAHPVTLVRVLVNLLSNAIKFVAPKTRPQIRVFAEARSHSVIRLWVEDNGIGIAAQYQQQIFEVLERLHGVEAYPGTGIGLAIVQKGVERMGGVVGVESALGQGSRFWIELPAADR